MSAFLWHPFLNDGHVTVVQYARLDCGKGFKQSFGKSTSTRMSKQTYGQQRPLH